jgi:hypothetical protein
MRKLLLGENENDDNDYEDEDDFFVRDDEDEDEDGDELPTTATNSDEKVFTFIPENSEALSKKQKLKQIEKSVSFFIIDNINMI